jgi:hypothetical protein
MMVGLFGSADYADDTDDVDKFAWRTTSRLPKKL